MQQGNRRILLKERPRFQVPTAKCFRVEVGEIPEPGEGQVRIRTTWLGLDPYLFSRVKQVSAQAKPIAIGSVMYGATVGRVDASNHPDYELGDHVHGLWGWQDYIISDGAGITKIDPDVSRPSYLLGALGATGFGAYLAVNDVLDVHPGEQLFCGAAVGALGQIVGQLARNRGATVIGAAGSDDKCRIAVEQLGYSACFNHRSDDFETRLRNGVPGGIDKMVVSTGGKTFDAAFPLMTMRGRIAVCGLMANYSSIGQQHGPDRVFGVLNDILLKRLEVKGSMVLDQLRTPRHEEFKREMKQWLTDRSIQPLEDVTEGLENAPHALHAMFDGKNVGKSVVRVAE